MIEDQAARAVAALKRAGRTFTCAESCTGGLVGKRVTDIAGSSAVYPGGLIVYSDFAKHHLLGVPKSMLRDQGAVSEAVARELAERVRAKLGTDFGAGVTGIAGPDGDGSGKPVGLIYVALSDGAGTVCRELHLHGDRSGNRREASDAVFAMVLERLGEKPERCEL